MEFEETVQTWGNRIGLEEDVWVLDEQSAFFNTRTIILDVRMKIKIRVDATNSTIAFL